MQSLPPGELPRLQPPDDAPLPTPQGHEATDPVLHVSPAVLPDGLHGPASELPGMPQSPAAAALPEMRMARGLT